MANTKHSVAREIIIDRLLHKRRGYSLYEMLETVNKELENNGFRPVSLNTIRNDIDNFRYLYKQKIEVEMRGYRNYYRYEDPNSTIFNNVLTFGEIQHLQSALLSIQLIDPIQGTLMYKELSTRLSNILGVDTESEPIVLYKKVPSKADLERFRVLYQSIRSKTPINITYSPVGSESSQEEVIHPYFILNDDNNYFLLGHASTTGAPAKIPISTISRMSPSYETEFIPNEDFHLKDFYVKHLFQG